MKYFKLKSLLFLFIGLAASFFFQSCDDGGDDPAPGSSGKLEIKTQYDLNGDMSSGHYTFFSLRTGEIVPATDSATDKWDVAFGGTLQSPTILTNGGTSGPGQGGAFTVTGQSFETYNEAPESGYAQDSDQGKAVADWYSYVFQTHTITMKDKFFVVKTADGRYAKFELLSFYEGMPAVPAMTDKAQVYSFRWAFAESGRSLETGLPVKKEFNLNAKIEQQPTGKWLYYSFATGDTVSASDSASDKWDLAFGGTLYSPEIRVNGGTSGPGKGGAATLNELFDNVTSADGKTFAVDAEGSLAIKNGLGDESWYTYNTSTHVMQPKPGKVFVIRTGDGKYAKMQIESFYKDAPAVITDPKPENYGYFTFKYVYQADGSKSLE